MIKKENKSPLPLKTASDLLDLIITINSKAAYEEALNKKPYQFLIESGLRQETCTYIKNECHIKTPSDITWGEALNLLLKHKYKKRFFNHNYLLATITREGGGKENENTIENGESKLSKLEFQMYLRGLFK